MTTTRPKIQKITITVDGKPTPVDVPVGTWAVFLEDQGVEKILVPYYNVPENQTDWDYSEALADFGIDIADKVFQGQSTIRLTGNVVTQVWNETRSNDSQVAFLIKKPACPIAGDY